LGGITGYVAGASNVITNSYSSGALKLLGTASATSYAGGIVGQNNNRVDIINSYSSAGINSVTSAGGLVGNSVLTATAYAYLIYSAAANGYIYAATAAPRIGGNLYENSRGCYAFGDIPVSPGQIDEGSIKDGVSVNGLDAGRPEFFLNTLGFSLDIWDTDYSTRSYKLPILKGLGGEQKDFPNTNHYY
jgi:hypothetical protein